MEVEPNMKTSEKIGNFFRKAWKFHKWISSQPEFGKGKNVGSGLVYALFFIAACIPAYDIIIYSNTYTDVEIKYAAESPILVPDIIVCPGPNSCPYCKQSYRNYQSPYKVWWNHKILELFNISNKHLELTAHFAQTQAFGESIEIPTEIQQYVDRAKEIVSYGYLVEAHTSRSHMNFGIIPTNSSDFSLFWDLLASVSPNIKIELASRHLQPKVSWLNKSFCLLFTNTSGLVIDSQFKLLKMTFPVNSKYWLGNLTSQLVIPEDLFTTFQLSVRQIRQVEVAQINDWTPGTMIQSVCQYALSALSPKCKPEYLNSHVLYIVQTTAEDRIRSRGHLNLDLSRIDFKFDLPIWHISKHNVYSRLAFIELTMGIFCLFLGFSCSQIMYILMLLLGKRWKVFKKVFMEFAIFALLLIPTTLVLISDLNSLFAPAITKRISLGSQLPLPSFRFSISYGLNFTRIQNLNISLALLQYVHMASTLSFVGHDIPNSYFSNVQCLEEASTRRICSEQISKLHMQYKSLATNMGINHTTPAFNLLENLYINKCQLIVGCEFNGKEYKNCCKQFQLHFEYSGVVKRLEAYYEMRNYNHVFELAQSVQPDMKIYINQNAFTLGPAYTKLMRNIHFPKWSRASTEDKIRDTQLRSVIMQFQIGTVINGTFILFKSLPGLKPGSLVEFLLQYKPKPEYPKQTEYCIRSGSCLGYMTDDRSRSDLLALNAKNIFFYKACGCFVCHKGMNNLMKLHNKCCSAEKAVDCLLKPLFSTNNVSADGNQTRWSESEVICAQKNSNSQECTALKMIQLFTTNEMRTWLKLQLSDCTKIQDNCEEYHGHIMFNNVTLKDLKTSLKDFGCGQVIDRKVPQLCNDVRLKYELSTTSWRPSLIITEHKLTIIEVRMNRASILNHYVSSRTNRQYSFLEALGIFLSAVGLFLGIDILCLIESFLNVMNSKKSLFQLKVQEGQMPLKAHLMRMFFGLSMAQHSKKNEVNPKAKDSGTQENNQTVNSNNLSKDKESNDAIAVGPIQSCMFFTSAIVIFFLGTGICTYVGLSNFLTATEYNFDVVKNKLPHLYPSFGICKTANKEDKNLQIPWNNSLPSFFNILHCWVEMERKPCSSLFHYYSFNGRHHCWLTNGASEEFSVTKQLLQSNDFVFVVAAKIDFLRKEKLYVWFGSLLKGLHGIVVPVRWNQKYRHHIQSYVEIRNESRGHDNCNNKLCSTCDEGWNRTCCSLGLNGLNNGSQSSILLHDFTTLPCHAIFKETATNQLLGFHKAAIESSTIVKNQFKSKYCTPFTECHSFWGVRRSTPYVFAFTEIPRHSLGARFALLSGYIDLFLGLSVVAFGGTAILSVWRKVKNSLKHE